MTRILTLVAAIATLNLASCACCTPPEKDCCAEAMKEGKAACCAPASKDMKKKM
jgi:hypothetical protein